MLWVSLCTVAMGKGSYYFMVCFTFFVRHSAGWSAGCVLYLEGKCQMLGPLVGDAIPSQGQPDQTTRLCIGDQSQCNGLHTLIPNVIAAKLKMKIIESDWHS